MVESIHFTSFQHSPPMCFELADALWFSAEQIQLQASKSAKRYSAAVRARMKLDHLFEGQTKAEWSDEYRTMVEKIANLKIGADSARVAAMLRGFSIENELKGGYYSTELTKYGHVKEISTMETHDLVRLSSYAKFKITVEDANLLEWLTKLIQLGRYQIGHRKKKTEYFADMMLSPDHDRDLRNRIKDHCRGLWASYQANQ